MQKVYRVLTVVDLELLVSIHIENEGECSIQTCILEPLEKQSALLTPRALNIDRPL